VLKLKIDKVTVIRVTKSPFLARRPCTAVVTIMISRTRVPSDRSTTAVGAAVLNLVHVGNRVTHHVNPFTKGYIQQINTKYLIYIGTG
jgi:ribosomal protein L30/L7E